MVAIAIMAIIDIVFDIKSIRQCTLINEKIKKQKTNGKKTDGNFINLNQVLLDENMKQNIQLNNVLFLPSDGYSSWKIN